MAGFFFSNFCTTNAEGNVLNAEGNVLDGICRIASMDTSLFVYADSAKRFQN
jgi:hypothetical protein